MRMMDGENVCVLVGVRNDGQTRSEDRMTDVDCGLWMYDG
jgi:hypothetical protein